ncbi:RidA family protein [Luteithermobacter gelatinilyticus]|uniref:RidA family protein n=1 Tax=Luteithermobacter gelatinilyticus TaxID=2582913 RepID=UPI001107091C|nr:RidA family protein [Luteithermobacter gelatinilyticus]
MTSPVEEKLAALGLTLPEPAKPVANYVPYVVTNNLISISGQIPLSADGRLAFQGKVGQDLDEETAREAARLCAINIIAQAKAACDGDLNRIRRIVKLGAFVNCTDGFEGQPAIINGASDLMVEIFGEKGRHSRSAVGVNALPLNVPVEIDALIEIS